VDDCRGKHGAGDGFPRRFGLIDWAATRRQAQKALEDIGIQLDPDDRVFDLSRTEKSLLAIARAVAVDASVLVLDEPTASLPADDVRHLFRVMNILREKQVGMIYITHRLDEVMEMADPFAPCAMVAMQVVVISTTTPCVVWSN
jgi:ribose transport system ATP-binding protein